MDKKHKFIVVSSQKGLGKLGNIDYNENSFSFIKLSGFTVFLPKLYYMMIRSFYCV